MHIADSDSKLRQRQRPQQTGLIHPHTPLAIVNLDEDILCQCESVSLLSARLRHRLRRWQTSHCVVSHKAQRWKEHGRQKKHNKYVRPARPRDGGRSIRSVKSQTQPRLGTDDGLNINYILMLADQLTGTADAARDCLGTGALTSQWFITSQHA